MKKANPNTMHQIRGLKMKETNYWERFLTTGSISDFLSYKNALCDGDEETRGAIGEDKSGEHSHAGIDRDYGNDFKG